VRQFIRVVPFFVLALGVWAQDNPSGMPAPSQAPRPYPNGTPGTTREGNYPSLPGAHKPKMKKEKDEDLARFTGYVRELATDHVVVETKDHRYITLHLTKDTKYTDADSAAAALKDITLGRYLDASAQEDSEGEYWAVTVQMKEPPATVVTAAKKDADEDARPKLHFGKPEEKPSSDTDSVERDPELASAAPAPDIPSAPEAPAAPKRDLHVEFLEKARETTFNFTDGLPNYMCQEYVTRYASENHAGTLWKPQDVVSADIVWDKDKGEEYRNVSVGGKKVDPEKEGDRTWSAGEFGSILMDILSPDTAAQFQYARNATLRHTDTLMYDFSVDRPHSHWTVKEGGQMMKPAYSGTIWFEKSSGRVLRLEYSAEDIPKEFPADTVERSIDYEYVQLGQRRFLLPVHSDVLGCQRGSSLCYKNAIDFRNYHKYGSEAGITFGGAEQNAPPLAPSDQPKPKK